MTQTTSPSLRLQGTDNNSHDGLAKIEWFDLNASNHGGRTHLSGLSFSIYRSSKNQGITFSKELAEELKKINANRMRVGSTVTGHVVFQFQREYGPHVTVNNNNAVIHSHGPVQLLETLLGITEKVYRHVYKLNPGASTGFFFIDGEQ